MPDGTSRRPRILVVEDGFLIAEDLCEQLRSWGYTVVGPVSRLNQALTLLQYETVEGALLDVDIAGEPIYPVAAALRELNIPFIFVTGYQDDLIPPDYHRTPTLLKPFDAGQLRSLVADCF